MDFCSSSHRNKWIISEDKLVCASKMVHLRHDPAFSDDLKFATAQGLLQKALREETNQKGIDYVIALRKEHGLPTDNLSPVSTEEEYLYSSYYTRMLAKGKKKWPPKVLATAITFVKRFFLHHSCMEHEVIKIVFTCLYIAGKVCEHYIDAGSIADTFPNIVKAEAVLELETVVLTGLQFDLVVYQPYHFVAAMIEELRVSREAGDSDLRALDATWKKREKRPDEAGKDVLDVTASYARSCVDSIVQSEALLLMSPQQQALSAVCTALMNYGMPADVCVRRYTRLSSQDESVQQQAEASLKAVLERGKHFAEAGYKVPDKDKMVKLDKQIRQFNPLMDKTSDLFKALRKKKKKKRKREEDA